MGSNGKHAAERYAVVTGANKGIGLETVRQLASQGVTVVLTARNEKRRMEALLKLQELGLSNIVFHQLDVLDPVSIKSLANFIQEKFGRLDIMVNNAGASGVVVDEDGLKALNIDPSSWLSGQVFKLIELHGVIETNYEKAEECLNTNYHGVRRVTEAVQPLLQLSPAGARIVNVSSLRSELKQIHVADPCHRPNPNADPRCQSAKPRPPTHFPFPRSMLGGRNGLGFGVGWPNRCFDRFKGVDLDALLDMSTNDHVKLLTVRDRRRFQSGLKRKPMSLIKKLR
ncbi:(+)-neomenthol dehydrogenase-like [Quercus lobata]|uniref:(+)-neomenthol dehydrogenase-like n=1 Tax=Quercus lobata TaxID=97700 RepID=UPI001248B17E|nr:(+)-neomenthol dehydrogenase-like [Quercus lobata]